MIGNYKGYYLNRNIKSRLPYIPAECIKNKRVLDVGSNSGEFTLELYKCFKPSEIVGLEIDKDLVEKSKYNLALFWSCSKFPLRSIIDKENSLFENLIKDDDADQEVFDYFPISIPLTSNLLSIYPERIKFIQGDVMQVEYDDNLYDTILLLSITKWIHINHGDDGIKRLFQLCFNWIKDGGILIMEVQPFSSYPSAGPLLITPFDQPAGGCLKTFHDLLSEVGFSHKKILKEYCPEEKGHDKRPIWLYKKVVN